MSTPTPRTSAAIIASGFQAVPEGFRAFAGNLERELTALTTERNQLRAEVERLSAIGSWSHTCIHHNDQQRTECPVCLVATLRAERDQLRAEVKSCGELSCDECNARTAAFMVERDQLRAELATAKELLRSEAMDDYAAVKVVRRELDTERAIVSRIWVQLGSPTYAQLKGRSIYDLIDELKADLAAERAKVQMLREDLAFYDAS